MRAFVCLLVAAAGVSQPPASTSSSRTIDLVFEGRARQYVLHVPPAPNGALVLVFHGGGQRASQIRRISGFDALADREHFIVAYPEAFERSWADGRRVTIAEQQGVDDVGFAKAVVADIAKANPVDRSRVFAAGLSNGSTAPPKRPHGGRTACPPGISTPAM